jgi:hypothetical protein
MRARRGLTGCYLRSRELDICNARKLVIFGKGGRRRARSLAVRRRRRRCHWNRCTGTIGSGEKAFDTLLTAFKLLQAGE